MICPSCAFDNLAGEDHCDKCGLTLMQEDTNPEYTAGKAARIITDPIYKVALPPALIVAPNAGVMATMVKMLEQQRNCALVVEKKDIVGIFTERDALKKITSADMEIQDMEIHLIMTKQPHTLLETDSISFAFNKMAMGTFRHVPIKKRDGGYSVFTARDAMNYLF